MECDLIARELPGRHQIRRNPASRENGIMENGFQPVEMLFLKCVHLNTDVCPHRSSIPMRLALINPAPRVMLSEKTLHQLYRLCSKCPQRKLP